MLGDCTVYLNMGREFRRFYTQLKFLKLSIVKYYKVFSPIKAVTAVQGPCRLKAPKAV